MKTEPWGTGTGHSVGTRPGAVAASPSAVEESACRWGVGGGTCLMTWVLKESFTLPQEGWCWTRPGPILPPERKGMASALPFYYKLPNFILWSLFWLSPPTPSLCQGKVVFLGSQKLLKYSGECELQLHEGDGL